MRKKPNYFVRILFFLFILFIILYAISENGYYEKAMKDKGILTEKKIREFEQDIENDEVIDLNKYYANNDVDYSSFLSRLGKKSTLYLSKSLKIIFQGSEKILKKLFW